MKYLWATFVSVLFIFCRFLAICESSTRSIKMHSLFIERNCLEDRKTMFLGTVSSFTPPPDTMTLCTMIDVPHTPTSSLEAPCHVVFLSYSLISNRSGQGYSVRFFTLQFIAQAYRKFNVHQRLLIFCVCLPSCYWSLDHSDGNLNKSPS